MCGRNRDMGKPFAKARKISMYDIYSEDICMFTAIENKIFRFEILLIVY